ncbi:MAG TPA: ABC transporter permease [Gemmatimonadaceae bacterium]|jgi:putative ABC transport system permease protein|nr:ABC transporter permease [Gemmatimonadaceae bacterium]
MTNDRFQWAADGWQDVRFALRSLRGAPAFAVAAISTLAIAIGANTAIFSVVNSLLLKPLPYGNPRQLVSLWGMMPGELLILRDQLRSESDIAAYMPVTADFDDGTTAERLDGAAVSANLFAVLQSSPRVGRAFVANESDPGTPNLVILGAGLWQRRFGSDPSVAGRKVTIDGATATVIGVMPPTFAFPNAHTDFWRPMILDRANPIALWTTGGPKFVGRLRPGTSIDAARREMQRVAPTLRHANPIWDPGATYGLDAAVTPLQDATVGRSRTLLLLLFACVVVVLIVACVNVANLLLARASAREAELAVRAALGGGRARLVRQLLTESIVLAVIGGGIGIALGALGLSALVGWLPPDVPRTSEIALSGTGLAFTGLLTILTGFAFGALPALRATRHRGSSAAARGGRAGQSVGHHRIAAALIVGEIALASLLGVGADLLVRSFDQIRQLDPGFRAEHLLTARITPAPATYKEASRVNALYDALLSRVAALPGVQHVAAVDYLPIARPVYGGAWRIQGQAEDVKHGLPMTDHSQMITSDYFAALGIPLVRGRTFTPGDNTAGQPVAIVSQAFARHFWPGQDPLGKRIGHPWDSPWLTIVGVVADVRTDSLRDTTTIAVYTPFEQRLLGSHPEMTVVVRTAADPSSVARALRQIVAGIDRSVPISEIRTMDGVIRESLTRARFLTGLVSAFAVAALLLGAVGIYGVMSYLVSQRMHEMGVRLALGASSSSIIGLVVRRAAILAACGVLAGMAAALIAVRPLRALLFGVSASDPVTYIAVGAVFVLVSVVASAVPAFRATRVSPLDALRAT